MSTESFAHQLRALLDELGLDVDVDGSIFKTKNTHGNLGVRADRALGRKLFKALEPIRPRGITAQPIVPLLDEVDLVSSLNAELLAIDQAVIAALEVAEISGQSEGAHHKTWVIDQMVRALTMNSYREWLARYRAGDDGPNTYTWDEGIAP